MRRRMRTPVLGFYDRLARDYDLIYPDWEAAIASQSRAIDRIIRGLGRTPPLDLLDCACGIGTQSIGLALLGYRLLGTDLSTRAIRRARREARARGLRIRFVEADFRALHKATHDTFDAVICCDNSLAHMMTSHDLARAAQSIAARLNAAGFLIASIRDYDELIETHSAFTPPVRFRDPAGSRIVFQHWNWRRDGRTYDQHLFILRGDGDRWVLRHHLGRSRALLRDELAEHLRDAGFKNVSWMMPQQTGYHQPIVIARRA
jgi:SAM-dependent methyltransferase